MFDIRIPSNKAILAIDIFLNADSYGEVNSSVSGKFKWVRTPQSEQEKLINTLYQKNINLEEGEGVRIFLNSKEAFKKALPALKMLSSSDCAELFYREFLEEGNTPLHDEGVCASIYPLLEKMDKNDLCNLLKERSFSGKMPLHNPKVFSVVLPLLKEMDEENILFLFSRSAPNGETILHNPEIFCAALPLLENLEIEDLIKIIFLIEDSHGGILLHHYEIFQAALPLLDKLDKKDLVKIFSHGNDFSETPLHSVEILALASSLLSGLPEGDLMDLLAIKSDYNISPISNETAFLLVRPILGTLEPKKVALFFKEYFLDCVHPLFLVENFKAVEPLLKKMSIEDICEILFSSSCVGCNPLDNKKNLPLAISFLKNLSREKLETLFSKLTSTEMIEVSKEFKKGISLEELALSLTSEWLSKSKQEGYSIKKGTIATVPLQKKYLSLWDSLTQKWQGDKSVDLLFEVNEKIISFPQVRDALVIIFDKLVYGRAWLGTPREENTEALLNFYQEMAWHLEMIWELIQDLNEKEQIAHFIGIAIPQLEGRCGTAYLEEFAQKSRFLKEKFLKDEDLSSIEKCAEKVLRSAIEKISGEDSHEVHQFEFFTGFSSVDDHLAKISKETAFIKIKEGLSFGKMVSEIQKILSFEEAEYLSSQNIPDTFDRKSKNIFKQFKESQKSIRKTLKQKVSSKDILSKVFSLRVPTFSQLNFSKELISHEKIKARWTERAMNLLNMHQQNGSYLKNINIFSEHVKDLFSSLQKKLFIQQNQQDSLKECSYLLKHLEEIRVVEETFKDLTGKLQSEVIKTIIYHEKQMETLKNKLLEEDIYFDRKKQGTPLQAIKDMRKQKFIEEIAQLDGKVGTQEQSHWRMIAYLLKQSGIFTSSED